MHFVAESLDVPLSKVFGVATFYHLFMLKPKGRHACVVCTGTACYIKGAGGLVEAIESKYDVKPGETTDDKSLSVLTARCVGACGLAPAVVLDREVLGKLAPVELSSEAFQPGQIRRSRLAQVAGAFWMDDAETLRVVCFRSAADYVFNLLKVAAQPGSEVGVY